MSIILLPLTSTAQWCVSHRKNLAQKGQLPLSFRGLLENKNLNADWGNPPSIGRLPARQVSHAAWLPDCFKWQHSPQLHGEERVQIGFGLWLQGPPGGCFVDQLVAVWPKPIPDLFRNIWTAIVSHSHWMKVLHVGAFQGGCTATCIATNFRHCYCCGESCALSKWPSGILNNCREPVVSHGGQMVENAKGLLVGNVERAPSHLFVDLEALFT